MESRLPRRASRPAAQCTDPKTTRGELEMPITLSTYTQEHAMTAPQNTLQPARLLSTININTDSLITPVYTEIRPFRFVACDSDSV